MTSAWSTKRSLSDRNRGSIGEVANTSSRTLRLLSLLQTHRHWPGGELAGRLGVSARTLRRDIDRLRELGYPVAAERGVEGGYQLAAGATLPPLVIDDDEAVALAVGMQEAAQGGVPGLGEPALRALTKVVQVMPPRLRRRVDALRAMTVPAGWGGVTGPPIDAGILITVAQCCRDTERLRFSYTARGGQASERHVEPLRLVPLHRRWYLVAYDLDRNDWRSFRLDRLSAPHGTAAAFRARELPDTDAAAFVRRAIRDLPAPYAVEVLVMSPAGVVRDRIGRWCTVTDDDGDDGQDRCVVRLTSDALEWPAMALGTVGADFEVRSPPELVELVREWGLRFSRAAAG